MQRRSLRCTNNLGVPINMWLSLFSVLISSFSAELARKSQWFSYVDPRQGVLSSSSRVVYLKDDFFHRSWLCKYILVELQQVCYNGKLTQFHLIASVQRSS